MYSLAENPIFPRVPCDVILHRDDQTPMESKPLF